MARLAVPLLVNEPRAGGGRSFAQRRRVSSRHCGAANSQWSPRGWAGCSHACTRTLAAAARLLCVAINAQVLLACAAAQAAVTAAPAAAGSIDLLLLEDGQHGASDRVLLQVSDVALPIDR